MALFRRTDEQDVATGRLLQKRESQYLNLLSIDPVALHRLVQNRPEGIFAKNTDFECIRALGGIVRPNNEFPEVVEISRFDLRFCRPRRLCRCERIGQDGQKKSAPAGQSFPNCRSRPQCSWSHPAYFSHVICPYTLRLIATFGPGSLANS